MKDGRGRRGEEKWGGGERGRERNTGQRTREGESDNAQTVGGM